jgi:hypothetical protein
MSTYWFNGLTDCLRTSKKPYTTGFVKHILNNKTGFNPEARRREAKTSLLSLASFGFVPQRLGINMVSQYME